MTTKSADVTTELALIKQELKYLRGDVTDIKQKLEMEYVTRQEFEPIRKIVYGMVSLILVAVTGAIISLVVNK